MDNTHDDEDQGDEHVDDVEDEAEAEAEHEHEHEHEEGESDEHGDEDEDEDDAEDDEDAHTDSNVKPQSFEKRPPTKGEYVLTLDGDQGQIEKVFPRSKKADVAWLFSEKGSVLKSKVEYPPAAGGKFLKSDQVNRMEFKQLVRWNGSKSVCTDYNLRYMGAGYAVFNKDGTVWTNLRKCGKCQEFGHNRRNCEKEKLKKN